jgi:hypothetical protein
MMRLILTLAWVNNVGFVGYVVALEQGFLSVSVSCCCYRVIVLYLPATAPEV